MYRCLQLRLLTWNPSGFPGEAFTKMFRRRDDYQVFEALKGISFSIGQGEVVGVVGRNGTGKSTVLKVIAGIYEPTSGQVETVGKIAAMNSWSLQAFDDVGQRQGVYRWGR